MAGSTYARGRSFEYRVKYALMDAGYEVARSPMSRGPWDLAGHKCGAFISDTPSNGRIAVTVTDRIYVQCKFHARGTATCLRGYVPPADWNRLWDSAQAADARPLVAYNDAKGHIRFMELTARKRAHQKQPWCDWEP